MIKSALFLVAALILFPSAALAFGPVAHVDMALEIISSASVIGGAVGSIISRYRRQFILGTLDPDRTLAKNLARYEDHSHNWDRAIAEFRNAADESEQARSLGRICHLAADTVAHNYFVPVKMLDSFRNAGAGHFYWEVRFDTRLREMRGEPDELGDLAFNDRNEIRYLKNIIKPTVATGNINARLTGVAMSVQNARPYMAATRTIDRHSGLAFSDEEMMDIRSLALQAQLVALSGLIDGHAAGQGSGVFELDPRGISCIQRSRELRTDMKKSGRQRTGPAIMVGDQLRHHEFFRNLVVSRITG